MRYIVGNIFDDELGRFEDGYLIHTSSVKQDPSSFKEGAVVRTRNNVYLLGKPYVESNPP